MKKNRLSRLMAYMLTLCMLVSMLSGITFTVSAEAEPAAAASGIEFSKKAQVNNNGTIDITMEAYTTGTVTNESSAVPTDIILVLDVSGSMDEIANHESNRGLVYGEHYTYRPSFSWSRLDGYGFNDSEYTYYKKNADESYTQLRYVGRDDNGFEYFTDGGTRYYPILKDGLPSNRENGYAVIQFYREMTHMEILKEGASAFISVVEEKNAQITDDAKKHRISIVKFATADYWNGREATDDHEDAVIGNNSNYIGYNYTQVVKGLTVVDAEGETELLTAIDNLNPGGATAVDYGIQLAEDVLGDRPAAEAIGRSEAVIVFTDGSPTHGSSYEESVAGSAINEALALKQAGVKIFSIGGADSADSSILGDDSNQFMHYISNNYPNASYAAGTDDQPGIITPGEGSVSGGFYMTPSEDKNLESIFMDIFQQTVNLDITMGSTAGVIDTISPFFTIPDGANSVTLQVAEKTASDWADAVSAEGVEPRINGNTLTVRGFDFDANYVSETPRMVDGAEFYGKKLIITINVTPDYDEIDLHKDSFEGGVIPTNEGLASVVNSSNEAVISVESPTVTAKKVTYMVDGEVYDYFYRFPGSEDIEVLDDISKTGYNFNGWETTDVDVDTDDTYTMPNKDVVFTGSFSANKYNVTYVYSGYVPEGVSDLPNDGAPVLTTYGTTVTLAAQATAPGYYFVGWTPRQEGLTINTVNPGTPEEARQFTMPAYNVTLIGYFTASESTPYKVEHYTETFTDGEFELKEREDKFGETRTTATAQPKSYTGFTFDNTVDGTILSDTIKGDGTTTLKLYYTRNKYDVIYEFDGSVPSGVTAPSKVTKKYGESYTVEDAMDVDGYDFLGWYYTSDLTYTDVSGNTITVDRNIYLAGEFTARTDTEYTVEHWLQNVDDDDYTRVGALTESLTGTTDTDATAYARTLTGFTFNKTETEDHLEAGQSLDTTGTIAAITANIDGDGNTVIKFYYDRNTYKVTYKFEGTVPTDAPDTDGLKQENIRYGALVTVDTTVPDGAMPTGYDSFYGWYRGAAIDANLVEEFEMPARDVELLGYFIPAENTAYTVRHFLQNAEDNDYTEDRSRTEILYGSTLQDVTAYPLPTILGLGYTYNADVSTASGKITADGSLELLLYYDRIEYPVTYQYINAPTGAESEPTDSYSPYRHGKEVSYLGEPAVVPGYTFHGWHVQDADIETTTDGFIMPNRPVVVYGAWTPNSNTGYKVEHYYEGLNGVFGDGNGAATPKFTETQHTGTTGQLATAAEIPVVGFTLDTTIQGTVVSATIAGNGSTVLKLYYKRNTYNVTYEYSGAMPNDAFKAAAEALLPTGNANVKHGATITIAGVIDPSTVPALKGYSFNGWTPNDGALVITENSFTMPTHDVILTGHFHPDEDTPYTINHFLEKEEGGYPATPAHTEKRPGVTNENATVYARRFDGFTIDLDTTQDEVVDGDYTTITKEIAGDGSTEFNFYYKRNINAVTYEFDGLQPHGVTVTIPNSYNDLAVKYGTTVTIKADLAQAGYEFVGWYSEDPAVAKNDATFTMPNKSVVLRGKFTAKTDTAYKVQYHLQKLNAEETDIVGTNKETDYELQIADTVDGSGTTGHTATAEIKHFDGFIARTDNTITAIIKGDGSTVINLYYDRVTNPITYYFYGTFPDHQTTELDSYNVDTAVPYGAKREVKANIICDPSHRHVPTDWASPHVAPVNNEFTMPATKVDFYTAVRHIYKVEYDLNGGTGAADVSYATIDVFAGTVIDVKPAPTKASYTFTGWKLDGTDTIYNPEDEITVNEDVKLIAQYDYSGSPGGGGGGVTRYTLTYDTNGGSAIAKETHNSGKVVELTKVPKKDGYIFDGWHLDSALSEDVDEVKMTKNITVYADWVEDNGNAGNGHDTPGSLNGEDHFAYVVGYPDGTVRPNANIDRAEVTTIFFRLLKEEIRNGNLADTNSFKDVSDEDWHNTAISTMTKLGIVKGRYTDRFVPDAAITRAEFAVICARFDDSEFEVVDDFTDVQGHWAEAEIHEAAAHGWIRGYEDGTFKPDQFITRAEAMTMINRVLNRVPETVDDLLVDMIKWSDNSDKSAWYYLPVQEATNSHEYDMKNHIYEKWTALREVTDWTKYE